MLQALKCFLDDEHKQEKYESYAGNHNYRDLFVQFNHFKVLSNNK